LIDFTNERRDIDVFDNRVFHLAPLVRAICERSKIVGHEGHFIISAEKKAHLWPAPGTGIYSAFASMITLSGSTQHFRLLAPRQRPGERDPSFTCGTGKDLAGFRFEDGDEGAIGNVVPVFGLFVWIEQSFVTSFGQVVHTGLQCRICLQGQQAPGRLRSQTLAERCHKAVENGSSFRAFHAALPHRGDAFRVVYVVPLGEALWVVHAFQKKATHGIKTPKRAIDLIRERLRRLKEKLQ
jgi:hypothetical protein